jgi:hypothetical protein
MLWLIELIANFLVARRIELTGFNVAGVFGASLSAGAAVQVYAPPLGGH